MEDVRGKMARGVVWMLLFKLVDKSVGLASTLILARLLTPDNFGVVAMATSFIAMIELIGAFGFDMALIQRPNATRAHFDTAWTFAVIFGCVLSALIASLSVPIAHFYKHPDLVGVICTLAVGSFLQGFQNVGVVAFRKDLEFSKEFKFLATKRLVTFPLTITLAFVLRNYWALVIAMTTGKVIDVLLSYRMHPYRPKFSLAAAGDLMHFSRWLLFLNILQFMRDRSSDFVIGRLAGAGALGLFSVSYELANMPGTELVAPINRAVYPAYAKLVNDRPAMQREYLSVMAMISLVAIPAVAGMAATANIVVPLVLGPQWLSAIPILEILAFFGISQVMQSNAYALFLALNRGDVFAKLNGAFVVLLVALLLVLVPLYGVEGGAIAYLSAALIMLPIALATILHTLELPVGRLVRELWRPLLAAGSMFWIVEHYAKQVSSNAPTSVLAIEMAKSALLGFAVYVLLIVAFWVLSGRPASAESVIWNRISKVIDGLRLRFQRGSI